MKSRIYIIALFVAFTVLSCKKKEERIFNRYEKQLVGSWILDKYKENNVEKDRTGITQKVTFYALTRTYSKRGEIPYGKMEYDIHGYKYQEDFTYFIYQEDKNPVMLSMEYDIQYTLYLNAPVTTAEIKSISNNKFVLSSTAGTNTVEITFVRDI